MNIFIVEDETLYAEQLVMIAERAGHTVCGLANNAVVALQAFEKSNPDLAIVDINLEGEMDGLELGKWLKRFKEDIIIIFVTAHYEEVAYFEKASQLAAFGFLKKPIDELQLSRTIILASRHQLKTKESSQRPEMDHSTLVIKIKAKYVKINQADIVYIEAEDKYCAIHLDNGTMYLERGSLKDLNRRLSPHLFAQTHRSFLVNLLHVREVNMAEFTVNLSNHWIPLGETYKDYFLRKFGA